MTARLASLLAAAALCAAASPAFAQDWHDGPPPGEEHAPYMHDGHGPMPQGPRDMRAMDMRRHVEGAEHERGMHPNWDGALPPPGPGMMMPPPLPGAPGPMMTYVYPSPYPGWVYPPVAWVKVPIVRERAAGCGCREVIEETVVTRETRVRRPTHHRREPGKWVRSTK